MTIEPGDRIGNSGGDLEARILARQYLAPQIALQAGVVGDTGTITFSLVAEDGAALRDSARPDRLFVIVPVLEKFIGVAVLDPVLRHAGQDHAVGGSVGAAAIVGVHVDEAVAGPGVVLAEIEEGRTFLFQMGKPEVVRSVCDALTFGKKMLEDYYIHRSAEQRLPPLLRLLLFAARQVVGVVGQAHAGQ